MTKEANRESGEAILKIYDYLKIRRLFERMKKMDDMFERIKTSHGLAKVFNLTKKQEFLWVIMNREAKTKSSIFSYKSSCRDALVEKSISSTPE